MSYYENRIRALEARIEEMSMLNRMKAIPVEAKLMERIGELNKENARLKAEVENLRKNAEINTLQSTQELARPKAEVERLTEFTTRTIIPNEILQAQVERLTKAGDELHIFLISYIVEGRISSSYLNELDDNWNAAKEGKQS